MCKEMFQNDVYITRGIKEKLNALHYLLLFNLIEEMQIEQKDYLQVFNITTQKAADERILVKVEHTQENPDYRAIHKFYTVIPIEEVKIFVIDDGDHTTMLLASEY